MTAIVIAGLDPAIGTYSFSLAVPPHMPDLTMDHRVKPGGDAVGSVWSIPHAELVI